MVWTSPISVAVGDMADAAFFNTYLRDNFVAFDQHAHTGAAGDGESFLSSLDYIDLDHQATLDAPAAGHLRLWGASDGSIRIRNAGGSEQTLANNAHASDHEPSGGDVMAVDAAVGTGSLRTIGSGAAQLAAGNHAAVSDHD